MSNDPSSRPQHSYGGYFLEQFQSQFQTKWSDGGLICVFTMVGKPIGNTQIEYRVNKKWTYTGRFHSRHNPLKVTTCGVGS